MRGGRESVYSFFSVLNKSAVEGWRRVMVCVRACVRACVRVQRVLEFKEGRGVVDPCGKRRRWKRKENNKMGATHRSNPTM
jgi:hypothetical protein